MVYLIGVIIGILISRPLKGGGFLNQGFTLKGALWRFPTNADTSSESGTWGSLIGRSLQQPPHYGLPCLLTGG